MNAKTHLIGGFALGVVTLPVVLNATQGLDLISVETLPYLCATTLGGLLPDIDHRRSMIGQKAKVASYVTSKVCGHRGITHAPLVATLVWFLLCPMFGAFVQLLITGLYVGVMSHIVLDGCTRQGIPLLYPFSKKKYHVFNIRTGSSIEKTVDVLLIVGLGYIVLKFVGLL